MTAGEVRIPPVGGHDHLGVLTVPAGTAFAYRFNGAGFPSAIYFGRSAFRWNDPRGEYGVLYAAATVAGAFAETVGHDVALREPAQPKFLGADELDAYRVFRLRTTRALQLANFHGVGLGRLNLDGLITSCRDYSAPRAWSRWVYEHPGNLDGLLYHSRHLPTCPCYALFDRCQGGIEEENLGLTSEWTDGTRTIYDIMAAFGWGLVP